MQKEKKTSKQFKVQALKVWNVESLSKSGFERKKSSLIKMVFHHRLYYIATSKIPQCLWTTAILLFFSSNLRQMLQARVGWTGEQGHHSPPCLCWPGSLLSDSVCFLPLVHISEQILRQVNTGSWTGEQVHNSPPCVCWPGSLLQF